jgi:LCP family protein required for cell wall assembly
VRHGRLRSPGPWATIGKLVAVTVAVLCVSSVSIAAGATLDVVNRVEPGIHLSHLPGHTSQPIASVGAIEGDVNLLLVGTDTRTGQGGAFESRQELAGSSGVGNNDVTMLLHIAGDHKSATVVSFPRDLMVPIPACPRTGGGSYPATGKAMLNTTLFRGGLPCTVLTIEALTGLQIPFAAVITFDGVTAMSDAIGGVTVCLATPVVDRYTIPPLNLAAGSQTLVGPMALSFLRSRHGVGDGSDLGRISNQQVFLAALARKIESAGVLSNPFDLYPLARAAVSNMRLSDTLTNPTTLVSIGLALKGVGLADMVFLQYPTFTDPQNVNRVIPNSSAANVLTGALQADQPIQLSGKPGRAAVLEGSTPSPPAQSPSAGGPSPSDQSGSPAPGTTGDAVVLPPSVTGQTAAQQTCTTRGR